MSAFDVVTKTIRHDSWDEGEEVVIKEPTYGENTKISKDCTKNNGDLDELKLADMMLVISIVSWTFKQNGKEAKLDLQNIKALPTSYVTFIAEQIGAFAINADDEFPNESGTSS